MDSYLSLWGEQIANSPDSGFEKKFGKKPGPKFKEILGAVATRQFEGTLAARDEALAWVRSEGA